VAEVERMREKRKSAGIIPGDLKYLWGQCNPNPTPNSLIHSCHLL
jgi:hypothetical protein